MRISEFKLHPVAIADGPLRSSYGRHAPYALRTIVELKTDDGITGISETYGGDGPIGALESVRSLVLGRDPYQLTDLWMSLAQRADRDRASQAKGDRSQTYLVPGENPLDLHTRTYAALEVACLIHAGVQTMSPGAETGLPFDHEFQFALLANA